MSSDRPALKRGPGRPPGARNKLTERTVALLLSRHRDPREVLLEIAEANVHDLAALLGWTPFEAMQERQLYSQVVASFLHACITPQGIDNRQVIHLTFGARLGHTAEMPRSRLAKWRRPGAELPLRRASSYAQQSGCAACVQLRR